MNFAQRLKSLREKAGLTQEELAGKINTTRSTLGSWEIGNRTPELGAILKVAEFFKVSTDYLLYGFHRQWLAAALNIARLNRSISQYANDIEIDENYLQELCAGTSIIQPSLETVYKIIKDNSPCIPPGIEIIEAAGYDHTSPEIFFAVPSNSTPATEFIKVPVVGRIPAGSPIIAEENIESYEDVPSSWLNGDPENYFVLKIDGDSMEGAKIFDGDLALIKKCPTCDNGQICAVGIMGETPDLYATLKRVHGLDEEHLELVPENAKYPRRKVKRSEVNIFGVLKKTFRNY